MIRTIIGIEWTNLKRGKAELLVTFVVPIVFFSIFAMIFGGMGGDPTEQVEVAIVDEDGSEVSKRLVQALVDEGAIDAVVTRNGEPLDRELATELLRDGKVNTALVLPKGLGAGFPDFEGEGVSILLLSDLADPIAPQMVQGLLQKVTMTSLTDLVMAKNMEVFEKYAGPLTPDQRNNVDTFMKMLQDGGAPGAANPPPAAGPPAGFQGMISIEQRDVEASDGRQKPLIAYYAAAIAVMFMLFAASGAGGTLLEEEASDTLERLLATRLGMTRLLLGKWTFLTIMGVAQIVVMFVWGMLWFDLDLFGHLPGFVVMTVVTSAAASGFGLLLATACRSRGQLAGVSTIVILTMSAMGGSMFPRFIMSDTMQTVGLATFNAWAIEGYTKIFWRDAAFWETWPQVGVLALLTCAFLGLSRFLARRWELV